MKRLMTFYPWHPSIYLLARIKWVFLSKCEDSLSALELLEFKDFSMTISRRSSAVELLNRNQRVGGSNPSKRFPETVPAV